LGVFGNCFSFLVRKIPIFAKADQPASMYDLLTPGVDDVKREIFLVVACFRRAK